jgi:ABC-type nitrate/sulfonate/bicarbonate transport system ATPase subunit
VIEIVGVSKTFLSRDKSEVLALEDVNLTIRDNEFLTVLGPSGCGKTTLLRNIAGLEPIDSGSILIEGVPVTGPGSDRAMVFQSFALLPWLNVVENVAFGLRLRGTPKKAREDEANRLIEVVGLAGFEKKLPGELSGGMQQRVGLARALAVRPRVLLMDEPFGALDEQTRRILQEELLRIWEETRTTVVFVTHSIDEAVLLGDRIVVMSARPGKIDEIVDVPLPRPRSDDIDSLERSAEWTALRVRLWTKLRGMQAHLPPAVADVKG